MTNWNTSIEPSVPSQIRPDPIGRFRATVRPLTVALRWQCSSRLALPERPTRGPPVRRRQRGPWGACPEGRRWSSTNRSARCASGSRACRYASSLAASTSIAATFARRWCRPSRRHTRSRLGRRRCSELPSQGFLLLRTRDESLTELTLLLRPLPTLGAFVSAMAELGAPPALDAGNG